jgi:integrase
LEPNGIFVALLLWSGARPNEAAGLRWKDVNWEKGSVEIRQNIVRLHGRVWEIGTLKTENSNRTFTMPQSFMLWLKEHRQAQLELRMSRAQFWQDYDLVFPGECGEPITSGVYYKLWKRILGKAGISEERAKMRPYDARHTMATLSLLAEVQTKIVSARLGHSKESITSDVYQHVLESMQEQATTKLEQAILGAKDSNKH